MHVTAYLFFNGNCAEALSFYEKAVGATLGASYTYGASPAASHVPAEMKDKIINASFTIGDSEIMASDCPPDKWFGKPTAFSLTIGTASVEEAETVFAGLSDGATITMAMAPTFFAERFGQLVDRFGVSWMVIFEKT